MAVDETLMIDFYDKHNVTEQGLIDNYKHYFVSNYPLFIDENTGFRYFGFVALQIYVAYLMHNDNNYTERAYRPRLAEFLQIDNTYELARLFVSYQDNAWQKLKKWGEKNDFIICIPKQSELQWNRRYVSYPLSQALLNQEDLKKSPILFQNAGLKPDEYLAFEDFVTLIKDSDKNVHLSKHYYRVKEKLQEQNREQLLQLQLFGFFNNEWDGSYPNEIKKDKRKNNNIEKNRTYLTICNNLEKLKILNQEYQCLFECTLENQQLFKTIKKYYNLYYPEILIFVRDKSYDEWIDCRYLEPEREHIIICKTNSRAEAFIHNLDSNHTKYANTYYSIFKVRLSSKTSNHFYWKAFFSGKLKNFIFENGLKLSRKTWMFGAGPTIRFFEETDVWINGGKLTFNNDELNISCRDFEEGTFRLKVKDLPPEKFQIKKPTVIPNIDSEGWQVKISEPIWEHNTENYQISGLSTWFPVNLEKASTRTWITALTQKSGKIKNSSIIINAIKHSKYGTKRTNNKT